MVAAIAAIASAALPPSVSTVRPVSAASAWGAATAASENTVVSSIGTGGCVRRDIAFTPPYALVAVSATERTQVLARRNDINWTNLLTIVSVLILIGTEVLGVALAAGWAIAGMFELGDTVGHVLMGLFSLLALYAVYLLWRRAAHIEPIRGR